MSAHCCGHRHEDPGANALQQAAIDVSQRRHDGTPWPRQKTFDLQPANEILIGPGGLITDQILKSPFVVAAKVWPRVIEVGVAVSEGRVAALPSALKK